MSRTGTRIPPIPTLLSQLTIDVDKDWNNKAITNMKSLKLNETLYIDQIQEKTPGAGITLLNTSKHQGGIKTDTIGELTSGAGINLGDGALYIDQANKRVGVNETAPASALHVKGRITVTGEGDAIWIWGDDRRHILVDSYVPDYWMAPTCRLRRSRGTGASPSPVLSGDFLGEYQFGGYDGSSIGTGAIIRGIASGDFSSSSHPTDIAFLTVPPGDINPQERMRITADGKVGIGTTSPAHALDVNGHLRLTGGTRYFFVDDGRIIAYDATNKRLVLGGVDPGILEVWIRTDGIERIAIDSEGRIGIGTTSPIDGVHVQMPSGRRGLILELEPGASAYYAPFIIWDARNGGANYLFGIRQEGDVLRFKRYTDYWTDLLDIMILRGDNGYVGIGTYPAEKLHVAGGHILLDNNYALKWKDSGGTVKEMVKLGTDDILRLADGKFLMDYVNLVFRPPADNQGNIGTDSYRWALVRAVTITSGDIGFGPEDQPCPVCGKKFEVGDIVVLKVHKVLENGEFRARPVHLSCAG